LSTLAFENKSKTPKINPIFAKGEPNTVPKPTWGDPSTPDTVAITISGKVVAMLMIVAPMITLGRDKRLAMCVAALPNQSAPTITAAIAMMKIISSGILVYFSDCSTR